MNSPHTSHPVHPVDRKDHRLRVAVLGATFMTVFAITGLGCTEDDTSGESVAPTTVATTIASVPPTTSNATGPVAADAAEPAAEVAAKVGPSVVLIDTATGSGSGVVYDKRGIIFTNAHVVEGTNAVDVAFANGRIERTVPVIARDVARDIAVVRVAARDDLAPVVFLPTTDVRVGQIAIAIGAPFGLDQTVTQGIVSAVGRIVPSFGNCGIDMIQTDAPINPGNSGGALVDKQGRLIGMNTSIRTGGSTAGSVGVGFAVPADTIKASVERMLTGEATDLAFLGVGQASTERNASGVLVGSVAVNSPAAVAGIRQGDLLTAVNGETLESFAQLRARIQRAKPGDTFDITVLRDSQSRAVKTTLAKSPNCRT
jgi:putative serine protease PepD